MQIGWCAVAGVAGAVRFPFRCVGQLRAFEMGQGQILEEDLHELFAAQVEDEVVIALAGIAGLAAALATAATRWLGNAVALDVLGVAGAHDLAHTAVAVAEDGLAQVFLGDVNILAALHVTDAAAIHRAAHGVADLLLVPSEKTLPVADRFVLAR